MLCFPLSIKMDSLQLTRGKPQNTQIVDFLKNAAGRTCRMYALESDEMHRFRGNFALVVGYQSLCVKLRERLPVARR
jgi:hypothetical protein